jgi:hypothetical protein
MYKHSKTLGKLEKPLKNKKYQENQEKPKTSWG